MEEVKTDLSNTSRTDAETTSNADVLHIDDNDREGMAIFICVILGIAWCL